jgi:hypothetical protein
MQGDYGAAVGKVRNGYQRGEMYLGTKKINTPWSHFL